MKLNPIASNMTEVELTTDPAVTLLFSYKTPVAAFIAGRGYFRTEHKWSVTTSKHITKWLDGATAATRPQEFFEQW